MGVRNSYSFFLLSILCASVFLVPLLSGQKAYSACFRNGLPDDDCDGLANDWENSGSYLGIPLSGVSSQHKDIFVEIDAMVSHANSNVNSAIDLIKNKFAAAPVFNPDGGIGINLHVLFDDRNIPHDSCTTIWSEFDTLKNAWFGTATERATIPDIVSKKQDIYHYGILLHSQCGNAGVSGISQQPGNKFAISLGDPGWADSDGDAHPDGNTNQKAAAFMHELGHNLNLKHGGSANTPTCKPNYFSVMNNLYEFQLYRQPLIDYSNILGRDSLSHVIDELAALHEPHGIVGPTGFTGTIGTDHPITPPAPDHLNFAASGSPQPQINYDWWQPDSDTNEMNVDSSINTFRDLPALCPDRSHSQSFGYKDWAGIKYWDPPEDLERLSNQMQFQIPETNTVNAQGTNNSQANLLDDPSLPPCDLTDPKCQDSPCDPNEVNCKFKVIYNVTDDPTIEVGNNSGHSKPDVSINDIKNVSKSKILYIDSLINANLTNKTQIVNSLHKEIVNDSDSIVNLIQSNSYNNATLKLLKLGSLIETGSTVGIIESPQKYFILRAIDDAINMLRNMM
jgi:hypothetical protein